jgi:hypothetical protein
MSNPLSSCDGSEKDPRITAPYGSTGGRRTQYSESCGFLGCGCSCQAAWLAARVEALRMEVKAKVEFADFKDAAEFLGLDLIQMANDSGTANQTGRTRQEVGNTVTWT